MRRTSAEVHHSTGLTEMVCVEPPSGNVSMTTRCPFHRLQQDQVSTHTQGISMKHDASGTEPLHCNRIISLRSGLQEEPAHSNRSISVRPELQEAANDCRISKQTSENKNRVSSGFAKFNPDGKTRSAKQPTVKGEHLSRRRFRSRTQIRCGTTTITPTDVALETEPTEEVSHASVQTPQNMHQSLSGIRHTRKRKTEDIDPDTGTVADLPDYTLDNVHLTEMELETCKRIDCLARKRQQSRTGGRRVATIVAKDQNTPSAYQRQEHEVEAKSRLTKVMLESLDLGEESGHLPECSGDRAGRLTYRCSSSEVRRSTTAERMTECVSIGPETGETSRASRVTLPAAETDPRTNEENNQRLNAILGPMHVFIRPRPGTPTQSSFDQRRKNSSGEVSKATNSREEENKSPSSTRLQDASVAVATNVSSSRSSSSSCYDSCSPTSVASYTSGAARGLEATSARSDRTGIGVRKSQNDTHMEEGLKMMAVGLNRTAIEVKRGQNDTYMKEESLNEMNPASHPSNPDEGSVLPADAGSADAPSDRKRRVCVKVTTQFSGDRLSVDPAGNTKETLQSEESASVTKRRQKVSRRNNDRSMRQSQTHPCRPVRSTTIVIEPSTPEDTSNVPSSVNAHTYRLSKTDSPPSSNHTFDNARLTPRHHSAKVTSGTSEVALPGSSKNTSTGKATRSLRHPSPTKASKLQLSRRPRTSSGHRPGAVGRDGIGAKLCAGPRHCYTVQDGYAQLQKVRSIPTEFRLKEICREVNNSEGKTSLESDSPRYSVKFCTPEDHHPCAKDKTIVSCVSETSKDTSTSTNIRATSPISGDSARTGDAVVVRSSKDLGVVSPKRTEESFSRQSLKHGDERCQAFVGIETSNFGVKGSTDETVSHREEKEESSLKSRYSGCQEKSARSITRTFLVSSPGRTQSQLNQRHFLKTIRREQPTNAQDTKRTFLVGQSCVRKIPRRCPRNFNTDRRLRSLNNALQRARSRYTRHANLERRSEIRGKCNSSRDTSSLKICAGNLVAIPHSDHPAKGLSDKILPGQNTQVSSPLTQSSSPVQSVQLCSTPILGSTCPRSPLFCSPIPFLKSQKRPPPSLAKSRNYSSNTSHTMSTLSSSPNTPSSNLLNPPLRVAIPLDSHKESPKEVVCNRSKKDLPKDKVPVEPAALKNRRSSGSPIRKKTTKNTTPVVADSNEAKLTVYETKQLKTNENSSPSSKCILYKNRSQPVDTMLSNGRQSKIPLARCQPFHIIPAGTDVSNFPLRIHCDDLPPRSFRYSKFHRKIIERRLPPCIRQLPKLMLRKARARDKGKPTKV